MKQKHFPFLEGVLEGYITQMREEVRFSGIDTNEQKMKLITNKKGLRVIILGEEQYRRTAYNIGDILALSQSYKECYEQLLCKIKDEALCIAFDKFSAFIPNVTAPSENAVHHIRITKIRLERLQDISDKECMSEGIFRFEKEYCFAHKRACITDYFSFHTPREAYAAFVNHYHGKGTWERNPYVVVYEFKLID